MTPLWRRWRLSGRWSSTHPSSCTVTRSCSVNGEAGGHGTSLTTEARRHGDERGAVRLAATDRDSGRGSRAQDCWRVDAENVGVAYKWGGVDTPASFDSGIRAGKAAGDLYTLGKRRRGKAGVSNAAVGVDCSGFICRCWKLDTRYSTATLASACRKLSSINALRPGDALNQPRGHVVRRSASTGANPSSSFARGETGIPEQAYRCRA